MRIFNKDYLDKWNKRLEKYNLSLSLSSSQNNNNLIGIWRLVNNSNSSYSQYQRLSGLEPIHNIPQIDYIFNFSVSKKCSKRFYDLLQTILKSGVMFSYYKDSKETNSKIYRKNISEFTIEKSDIKIHEVEYIQNTCKLSCDLFEIIYFVSSVESAVEIISKYFEYEVDGNEICKTKFKVNDIVSIKEDKSGNYMILDFAIQPDNTISYILSKIQNNLTSEVIIFDGVSILREEDILPNREDRLNILLN